MRPRPSYKLEKKETFVLSTVLGEPKWKDIKNLPFQDDDRVDFELNFGNDEDDRTLTDIVAIRTRLETDEEFNLRIQRYDRIQDLMRDERYQKYLELKQEFEPPCDANNNFDIQ